MLPVDQDDLAVDIGRNGLKDISVMKQKSQQQSEAVRRFWEAFKTCVEENRVRPDRSGFYEKWVQTLVDFLPEKRLRERSQEDTEPFLGLLRA